MDHRSAATKASILHRVDEKTIVSQLSRGDLDRITENQLHDLRWHLTAKGIFLTLTEKVVTKLAREGFDLSYSAWPLKCLIQ